MKKEIKYNMEEFLNFDGETCPKINLRVKILSFREKNELSWSEYVLTKKDKKFVDKIKIGDILLLEYPIFFSRRTRDTLYGQPISITIESTGQSEVILSSRIEGLWNRIKEFSIIED